MNAKNGVPIGEGTADRNVGDALFDTGWKASFLRSLFRGSSYGGLRTRERQRFLAANNRYAVQRWCWKHLKNLRGVAQSGRAPALGAGCRQFESGYPDYCPSSLCWMDESYKYILRYVLLVRGFRQFADTAVNSRRPMPQPKTNCL